MLHDYRPLIIAGLMLSLTDASADQPCSSVPSGWRVEKSSHSGALCADVLIDADSQGNRMLRLFESGKKITENPDILDCRECGGVMGDPFRAMTWKKGVLTVTNSGGSRESWQDSWKIGKHSGQWMLIGWEQSTVDRATGSAWSESVNALTRQAIVTYTAGPAKGPIKELCKGESDPSQCENKHIRRSQKIKCAAPDVSGDLGKLTDMKRRAYSCGLVTP